MNKTVSSLINRIQKRNAVGIIYNIPKNDSAILINNLLDQHRSVVVQGSFADCYKTLAFRLGKQLDKKGFTYYMLPSLLDEKIVIVNNADLIKPSFSKVFDEFKKLKIPLLLLMNKEATMDKVRSFPAFSRVLTIEQNFKEL